jgi:hypothetical protein
MRSTWRAVAAAAWICSLANVVYAEPGPIRPEFEISTGTEYSYYSNAYPHNEGYDTVDIAASAAGIFVVVWEDLYTYQGGYYGRANPGVWARRLDSLGRPLGPEFRVAGRNSYAYGSAHVAANATGSFVVVWDDVYADLENPYTQGIVARRFNAGGGALGNSFQVNVPIEYSYSAFTPKVALRADGSFMVAWSSLAEEGGNLISARFFDLSGSPIGGEVQINEDPSLDCCWSQSDGRAPYDELNLAVNPAGEFLVVWAGPGEDGEGEGVRARRFDGAGAALGPERMITSSEESGSNFLPNVAVDGTGRFIVAWSQKESDIDVHARLLDSSGDPLGAEFQVSTQQLPYTPYGGTGVAADATGNFVITWDDGYNGVFGRRFDSSGVAVGDQFRIDELSPEGYDEFSIRRQAVATSAAGEFIVAWGQRDDLGDGYFGVVGRKLGTAPVPCTPAPKTGCRASISGAGSFTFKEKANPVQSSLTWKLNRGPSAVASDFGSVLSTDSYSFCLYDSAGAAQPLLEAAVPAGGACGALPCWKAFPGGRVDYFDRAREIAGIELIRMTPGSDGRAKVQVTGRGAGLELPALPLTAPVTVQLQVANGECWTATYASRIRRNADGLFKASPDS